MTENKKWYYYCPICETKWNENYDPEVGKCHSECPQCNKDCAPFESALSREASLNRGVLPKKLVISETSSSTQHYHLRYIVEGTEKFSGGAGKSLCGRPQGWDTHMDIKCYGVQNSNEHWCKECLAIAKEKKLLKE